MESAVFSGSVAGALFLTTLAGAATVLGAASAFFTRRTNTKVLSVALGLSGGVMVYISFVELLANANRELRAEFSGTTGRDHRDGGLFRRNAGGGGDRPDGAGAGESARDQIGRGYG